MHAMITKLFSVKNTCHNKTILLYCMSHSNLIKMDYLFIVYIFINTLKSMTVVVFGIGNNQTNIILMCDTHEKLILL